MAKPTKAQLSEKEEALTYLRMVLRPGAKVYTKVEHVARSGMSRRISLYMAIIEDNKPEIVNVTWYVARALGYKRNPHDGGITVSGCGMDMCFETVYNLGRVLFPKGGSLKHSPRRAQEERAGNKIECDGGYLLRKVDL